MTPLLWALVIPFAAPVILLVILFIVWGIGWLFEPRGAGELVLFDGEEGQP